MKNIETILSIIVPVYKVERYLERCLDCLTEQEKIVGGGQS